MPGVAIDPHDELRERIRTAALRDEAGARRELLLATSSLQPLIAVACARAANWVQLARARHRRRSLFESMIEQLPLASPRGRALLTLAEALLRTPDDARSTELVAEQLRVLRESPAEGRWLNRTALALLSTAGRVLPPLTLPAIRQSLRRALRIMASGFIAGETIEGALQRAAGEPHLALCSYDMLGEGARTDADARRYFQSYLAAIRALESQPGSTVAERSGISVKLSALDPRYSQLQSEVVMERLLPKLSALARAAADAGVGLTLDAEEADRLDLSLDLLEQLAADTATPGWDGLGAAVQAYGPRALPVVEFIVALARRHGRRMTVRLVKGAYWDTEIKRAQERGLDAFPVFTSKAATDLNYLLCAQRLLDARDVVYPQFATHNATTIAAILAFADGSAGYEFQRLQGMGELLYDIARDEVQSFPPVRVYAPVGAHDTLLPYLVRRLLENGANTSFVHQFLDPELSISTVTADPREALATLVDEYPIRLPRDLFGHRRRNSRGVDFGDPREIAALREAARQAAPVSGGPIIDGGAREEEGKIVFAPAHLTRVVGHQRDATTDEVVAAFDAAGRAHTTWDAIPAQQRAAIIEQAAELLEHRRDEFLALLVNEAGRTIPDALAEIREAVDYCRYYSLQAREHFGRSRVLPGPDGESNALTLHGRGVFACISPWNFPLAIFTGQIVAALLSGNTVVSKPSQHTPLIAHSMVRLLHDAGVPPAALHLVPLAGGATFGRIAFAHPALGGVVMTGSTSTALAINRALAAREGPIVPLIAETGGLNALIADATALPEQLVDDALSSAFNSAGQRCSALRILYVQSEIADRVIEMLVGAMRRLRIGDPVDPSIDVGPVISAEAKARLERHAASMAQKGQRLFACDLPAGLQGHYVAPQLFELRSFDELREEHFGPLLHIARYGPHELDEVIAAICGSGHALTFGVHSRIESFAERVAARVGAGNTYVNRNVIGAVVGSQPFGGSRLSGTGPKAGGPHYLLRFATERTTTINTAALGGNVELLSRPAMHS